MTKTKHSARKKPIIVANSGSVPTTHLRHRSWRTHIWLVVDNIPLHWTADERKLILILSVLNFLEHHYHLTRQLPPAQTYVIRALGNLSLKNPLNPQARGHVRTTQTSFAIRNSTYTAVTTLSTNATVAYIHHTPSRPSSIRERDHRYTMPRFQVLVDSRDWIYIELTTFSMKIENQGELKWLS